MPITDIEKTSHDSLSQVADLKVMPTQGTMHLIRELDDVLEVRWAELGLPKPTTEGSDFFHQAQHPQQEDFAMTTAIERGISWRVRAEALYTSIVRDNGALPLPYGVNMGKPSIPWLVHALSFAGLWPANTNSARLPPWASELERLRASELGFGGDGNTSRMSSLSTIPNVKLVESLLIDYRCDPNESLGNYSIWEYTIHLVHILGRHNTRTESLQPWVEVFKLMLQHGGDPHACCIQERSNSLTRDGNLSTCPKVIVEHASINSRSPTLLKERRGFDVERWDAANPHAYYHSVTAVVKDIFEPLSIPETGELLGLLKLKKNKTPEGYRHGRNDGDAGGSNSSWPHWVS
jgi:hypothetical protein